MPRQTTDDALRVGAIDDFRSSGLTQPEFCRRRGPPLHTFRRRLYARPTADGPHRRGLVEGGCRVQDRRKFHECRASDPERSHAAIAWIGRLSAGEREARAISC